MSIPMPNRPSLKTSCLCIALATLLLCSCEYSEDFDALSSFPANPGRLPIEELELKPVEGFDASDLFESSDPEIQADGNEIQPGVVAYPYEFSIGGSNRFDPLTRIDTGFDSADDGKISADNAALLWSPFTSAGIAIGDIDNDLLPEIFIANRKHGGRLYKNLGNMGFRDVTAESGILIDSMWASAATFVDINSDGWLDLYLCGYNSKNLLYINRNGKFEEQSASFGLDLQKASTSACFSDYDRDGDLDLYLVTARPVPNTIMTDVPNELGFNDVPRVKEEFLERFHMLQVNDESYEVVQSGQFDRLYRNDDGLFQDVTEKSGIGLHPYRGRSAIWSDFNQDNWPDLYVANHFEDPDQLFINLGKDADGEVKLREASAEALTQTTMFAGGVDSADLNNDGFQDLFVAGTLPSDRKSRATATGHLFEPSIAAKLLRYGHPVQVDSNSVLINTRDNRFVDVAHSSGLGSSGRTWGVRLEDFDNDGLVDVLLACGAVREFNDYDLNQDLGTTDEQSRRRFWFDQPSAGLSNRVFKNMGQLQFQEMTQQWGLDRDSYVSQAMATGDFDNDGDVDFIVGGFGENTRIYRNNMKRRNSIRVQLVGVNSSRTAIGATVRVKPSGDAAVQTQIVNPVRGFHGNSENVCHFGLGDATKAEFVEIEWPSGAIQKISDLGSDFLYRISEPETESISTSNTEPASQAALFRRADGQLRVGDVEIDFDQTTEQNLIPFFQSNLGPSLAWGDVDGDGDRDLFVGGSSYIPGKIFIRNGETLEPLKCEALDADVDSEDLGAVFFDADNDSDNDLYVVSGGVEFGEDSLRYEDRLYLNDGKGNFEKAADLLPQTATSGCCVAAADFDKDGRIDLFVGGRVEPGNYPDSVKSQLLKNTEDGFIDVTDAYSPSLASTGMVTACIWADVDEDDWPDLVLTHEWGSVMCFRNSRGKRFADATKATGLSEVTGLFNSICSGDVDNDGDLDFFVGNFGTNSAFQASAESPLRLYRIFINGANKLIEAVKEGEEWFPARTLRLLTNSIPGIGARFGSANQFAETPLSRLFTASDLQDATVKSVNELRSGFLIRGNDAKPVYTFVPLKPLAQISPVFGCQLVDVNGDGNLDLYLLQNESDLSYYSNAMINGRSQLLMGDGQGDFEPKMPIESGVDVTGDGAALTVCDLNDDGRPDFLAATNDKGLHSFVNAGEYKPLVINLDKFEKSPVGAKVTIIFNDGRKQVHHQFATSGYLSQSPPVIYSGQSGVESIQIRWPDGSVKSFGAADFIE